MPVVARLAYWLLEVPSVLRRILPALLALVLAGCVSPVTLQSPVVLAVSTATATTVPSPTPTPLPTATPTPIPTPTAVAVGCDEAIAAVEGRHRTTLGLLASYVGGISATCLPQQRTGAFASQPIQLSWTYKGADKVAVYVVAADGGITADDQNAQYIDAAAKYGPLGIKALTGL